MHLVAARIAQGLAWKTSNTLTNNSIVTLNIICQPCMFANLCMPFWVKNFSIRRPKITHTLTVPILCRNTIIKSCARSNTATARHISDYLPCPRTQSKPYPNPICPTPHKWPHLIKLKNIIFLCRQKCILYTTFACFFFTQRINVGRETPNFRVIPRILIPSLMSDK